MSGSWLHWSMKCMLTRSILASRQDLPRLEWPNPSGHASKVGQRESCSPPSLWHREHSQGVESRGCCPPCSYQHWSAFWVIHEYWGFGKESSEVLHQRCSSQPVCDGTTSLPYGTRTITPATHPEQSGPGEPSLDIIILIVFVPMWV